MIIQNWTLCFEDFEPLACKAPCSLYSVLYDHKKIPDPARGLNEKQLTSLSEKDCSFFAEISVSDEILSKDFIELEFKGLDTICHIYLNEKLLGKVKNMHRAYVYDVKDRLHAGTNTLRLDFKSPMAYFSEENGKHYLYTNDGDTLPGAAHLRKALYMSGWDWAPTLPDMGIFREVSLNAYNTDRLEDTEIRQYHKDKTVEVTLNVSTAHHTDCEIYAVLDGKRIKLENGAGSVLIENPRLWWVRGCGDQNLYDLDIELVYDGQVIDRCKKQIGLRTLTLGTAPDEDGKGSEFCFVVNGVKIFAMGANYVPQDSLLSRVTREKLDEMMVWCLDGNFNCLRVWGGGYYPDDYFFELCDRNGILVWLDFMIACANVRLSEDFTREFLAEAEYNLKRLRHHASLALLCGNNEMELAVETWGIGDDPLVRSDYLELYEHLLPELCDKYAPQTCYRPSSPSSGGGFDDPGDFARGDTHYWEVWHGGVPFTAYREKSFRFCSEYGFESFPSMKTIRAFCDPKDMNCFSRVMEGHQKCKGGNGKILRYLADNYLYPHSFENLVYASQLLQADAIRYGVEHFRRQRGYCMGSLYWQFNDCWPVASWSGVDCFGRYKALHYAAKKFYAPVSMGLFTENGTLTVNISNETMEAFRGTVRLILRKADNRILETRDFEIRVNSLTASDVCAYNIPAVDEFDTYLCAELYDEDGSFMTRRTELLVRAKHFSWQEPEIRAEFTEIPNGAEISVTANAFAKGVFLDFRDFDCIFSDNFFDLTDQKPYRVTVKTTRNIRELKENLVIKSVYDIR